MHLLYDWDKWKIDRQLVVHMNYLIRRTTKKLYFLHCICKRPCLFFSYLPRLIEIETLCPYLKKGNLKPNLFRTKFIIFYVNNRQSKTLWIICLMDQGWKCTKFFNWKFQDSKKYEYGADKETIAHIIAECSLYSFQDCL